jgi:hypothetical protein
MYCKEDPTTRPKEYKKILREWGFEVKVEYIRSIFRKWRWSWKKPCRSQLEKYSSANIENYIHFVLWVKTVPLERVKFLDEGKFLLIYFNTLLTSFLPSFLFFFRSLCIKEFVSKYGIGSS